MNIIKTCFSGILCQIAYLYNFVGKTNEAIQLFQKLKTLNPTDPYTRCELALCYSKKNETQKAKEELEEALVLAPDDWLLNRLSIDVLYQIGEPPENLVPYIKRYFDNKPAEKSEAPGVVKLLAKVFRPKLDINAHKKQFDTYLSEWDAWAESILRKYEHSHET